MQEEGRGPQLGVRADEAVHCGPAARRQRWFRRFPEMRTARTGSTRPTSLQTTPSMSEWKVSPGGFTRPRPTVRSVSRSGFTSAPAASTRMRGRISRPRSDVSSISNIRKRRSFTKTDLAKYLMLWEEAPDIVCRGDQKNFADFAKRTGTEWSKNEDAFNELFYRHLIARRSSSGRPRESCRSNLGTRGVSSPDRRLRYRKAESRRPPTQKGRRISTQHGGVRMFRSTLRRPSCWRPSPGPRGPDQIPVRARAMSPNGPRIRAAGTA